MSLSTRLCLSLVLVPLLVAGGLHAQEEPAGPVTAADTIKSAETNGFVFTDDEGFSRLKRLEKPDVFDSWSERLDYIHNNVTYEMQSHVDKVDGLFATDTESARPIPHSRFQFGSFVEFSEDRGVDFRISPQAEVDIKLPNLERRLSLFIDQGSSADLPGTSITEQERGFNAGLRRATRNFRVDGGVKVRWPPELFGRLDWRPKWQAGRWKIFPLGRLYWESEDGYGTVGSLNAYRYYDRKWIVMSASAIRWTEKSNSYNPDDYLQEDGTLPPEEDYYFGQDAGWEWEQSFVLGYVRAALTKKHVGQQVSIADTAQATGLRVSVFGNTERADGLERVRFTFAHRRPIYGNWIYLSIIPEFELYKDTEWRTVPRIRMGVDMLFWASSLSGERLDAGAPPLNR